MEDKEEIDVVMLTKNSNKPYFKRVLNAIKRNIPIHHFIVIDGYSNDGTIEVIREFFSDRLIVVKTKACLGLARYIGMRIVDTEWFAFIDSDVEILDGWYESAKPLMKLDRIYGIQGVWAFDSVDSSNSNISVVRHISQIPREHIIRYGFYKFAGADSGHALLRKNVVKLLDYSIISVLEAGEDFYIAQRISEAGFWYVRTTKLKAIHHGKGLNLEKLLKRAFNIHGLALYLDTPTYLQYSFVRSLTALRKLDHYQFLNHVLYLLGLMKVKSIIKRDGYRSLDVQPDHIINTK
ncbi:MAG: glycosyltransferase family 2 protein [Desulfurococcaceae archaeon]